MKIGRIFFGRGQGGQKTWETVLSFFQGKYSNRFDVAISRQKPGGGYTKGTAIRYDDDTVLTLGDVYPKLALDDGFAIFRVDADGNPIEQVLGTDDAPAGADQGTTTNSDDIPF